MDTASEQAFNADDQEAKDENTEDTLDEMTVSAEEEVLSELRKLANEALEKRDMRLLYRIERTISEILND